MVFLIIILVIIGIIILVDITIIINICYLNKKINNRNNIIYSLMTQQYDLIVILADYLLKNNVNLPNDLIISLNLHEQEKELSTMERFNIKNTINRISSGLLLVAETTSIKDEKDYLSLKHSLNSFNKDYRKEVVLFNQAVYAYNYWIKFIFFRPIAKLFKMNKKDSLQ